MPYHSLAWQVEKIQRLLIELNDEADALPSFHRRKAEEELVHFSHAMEICPHKGKDVEQNPGARLRRNAGEIEHFQIGREADRKPAFMGAISRNATAETVQHIRPSEGKERVERALRESEARFHISIESLLESFVVFSAVRQVRKDGKQGKISDLRFEYVNAAASRIYQKPRGKLLGHTLLEVIPGELGKELHRRYIAVLKTGQSLMERAILGDSPESAPIHDIHAVRMGDGLVVTSVDVTDQVRAENARREAMTQIEIHQRLSEQSERDRQSYARELHDGPIQSLVSVAYQIQFLKDVFPDPQLAVELGQINSTVREAIRELRQVISELRPPSVLRYGLTKAIQMQAGEISENHPGIEWRYRLGKDENRLPATVSLAVFRIYQEAANNILRHSQATRAWVELKMQKNRITLEIRDNGKGIPLKQELDSLILNGHFGLAGMSERAEVAGGKLKITSKPGAGTKIRVVVPIPELEVGSDAG